MIDSWALEKVVTAVRAGHSVLVLGESGSGKTTFARSLIEDLAGFDCSFASYKGSLKKFLSEIAKGLDIPILNENGKSMTTDALKEEIGIKVNNQTVLLIDDAHRLPASIRYWLEGILAEGAKLVCLAITNPKRDIFLKLLAVELSLPSDMEVREVMKSEAKRLGLKLSRSQLASLQAQAGRNLMLAKKVVQAEALGMNDSKPEHTQYVDISSVIIAALMGLGVVRFIGLGTGNRALYIVGGIALILGLMFKQLAQVKGAKKKLGQ